MPHIFLRKLCHDDVMANMGKILGVGCEVKTGIEQEDMQRIVLSSLPAYHIPHAGRMRTRVAQAARADQIKGRIDV